MAIKFIVFCILTFGYAYGAEQRDCSSIFTSKSKSSGEYCYCSHLNKFVSVLSKECDKAALGRFDDLFTELNLEVKDPCQNNAVTNTPQNICPQYISERRKVDRSTFFNYSTINGSFKGRGSIDERCREGAKDNKARLMAEKREKYEDKLRKKISSNLSRRASRGDKRAVESKKRILEKNKILLNEFEIENAPEIEPNYIPTKIQTDELNKLLHSEFSLDSTPVELQFENSCFERSSDINSQVAEFHYINNKLRHNMLASIDGVSSIDSLLGKEPLEGFVCENYAGIPEYLKKCEALKFCKKEQAGKCFSVNGRKTCPSKRFYEMVDKTEETIESIKALSQEIEKIRRSSFVSTSRGRKFKPSKENAKKIKNLKGLISLYKSFIPWAESDEFEKFYSGKEVNKNSLQVTLVKRLDRIQSDTKEKLKDLEVAHDCLNKADADCSDFTDTITSIEAPNKILRRDFNQESQQKADEEYKHDLSSTEQIVEAKKYQAQLLLDEAQCRVDQRQDDKSTTKAWAKNSAIAVLTVASAFATGGGSLAMAAAMTVNSANLALSVHDSYKECSKKNLDLMQFNYQKGQVNLNACPSDPGQEEGYKNFSAQGSGCALSMLAATPDLIPFAGPLLGKVAKGILVGLKTGKATPEGYDRFKSLIETLPNVPPNRVQVYLASYEKMSPEMQEKFVNVMKKYQKVSCK